MKSGILFLVFASFLFSQTKMDEKWLTDYEKSGYKKTPRYAETMNYVRNVEQNSPWVKVLTLGKTPQGRDLSVIIISKNKSFTPESAQKSGKPLVFIQNGIHAGEIDGKDACLLLLRDICITKQRASLLDNVNIAIMPVFNVDGHERWSRYNRINQNGPEEMGWRVTAQGYNLNRDYIKADSPEMRMWLQFFTAWWPDLLVDCHVTDGLDFQYEITYGIENHQDAPTSLREWMNSVFLPYINSEVGRSGHKIAPFIMPREDNDISSGLSDDVAPPRFSTAYAVMQNRPGLLIETHMLKDYQTRVEATYHLLRAILEVVNQKPKMLRDAIKKAEDETIAGLSSPFALNFKSTENFYMIDFLGYEEKKTNSEITGKQLIAWTKNPIQTKVKMFSEVLPTVTIDPPKAYLIPQEWTGIIDRLSAHGLRLQRLKKEATGEFEFYRFSDVKWRLTPYENHHSITFKVDLEKMIRTFPRGTFVVFLNQRSSKIAVHALEPQGPDSFVGWGLMDTIFEQKEYTEDYVMDQLGREMLEKDPKLKQEFENKVKTDSSFAKSSFARVNFLYQRSLYWDQNVNLYPIARWGGNIPLEVE